ncbi:hypothetical protein GJ496_009461 [Pomphorhynchus laevis]|nr:hypothetical protein GJ496_009461 [Pomphorhynchus laevis]
MLNKIPSKYRLLVFRHFVTPKIIQTRSSSSKKYAKSFITWRSVGVLSGTGVLMAIGLDYLRRNRLTANRKKVLKSVDYLQIGGPFELTDYNGKPWSSKDFAGKWLLIYFGFTHCPDVCPEEIEKIIESVDKVNKIHPGGKHQIVPIFISVDPERDTPEVVKEYVQDFSPTLIGLTGSTEEVLNVAKLFRVYFKAGEKDYENDYIVDHSIISYLMDPKGRFVDYYGKNKSGEELTDAILTQMDQYKD